MTLISAPCASARCKQILTPGRIANKQIVLNRVYVHIEGGTFWVPNVKYIEFKGWNAATREPTVTRINV